MSTKQSKKFIGNNISGVSMGLSTGLEGGGGGGGGTQAPPPPPSASVCDLNNLACSDNTPDNKVSHHLYMVQYLLSCQKKWGSGEVPKNTENGKCRKYKS